jgi:HSP20 family protein
MSEDRRRTLRDMLDELDRYFEEFEKDVQDFARKSVSAAGLSDEPYVAGFSVRMSPEGRPSIQLFGNNPLERGGFRSPMCEQFLDEKAGTLRLVLDMPGVEKKDISIDATDDTALVKAETEQRRYRAEVGLKSQVEPGSGKAEYNNGLLEISFSLKDKANKGFKRVNIV